MAYKILNNETSTYIVVDLITRLGPDPSHQGQY